VLELSGGRGKTFVLYFVLTAPFRTE